jgi:hypothetical protein
LSGGGGGTVELVGTKVEGVSEPLCAVSHREGRPVEKPSNCEPESSIVAGMFLLLTAGHPAHAAGSERNR